MNTAPNLKQTVYNAIMEDIFSCTYLPGDIINEKSLIEKYECSKSPVRDALQALCAEHVLRSIPRYGYEVISLSMDDLQEMLQFRYVLESGMLRNSYNRLTKQQLSELKKLNQHCVRKTQEPWEHWSYNAEFHIRLLSFAGNTYAVDTLARCMDRLKRGYAQLSYKKWVSEPVIDTRNHELLLTHLENRDIDGAVACLLEDLNDFADAGFHIIP